MRRLWWVAVLLACGCPAPAPPATPGEPTWTVRLRAVGDDPRAVTAAVVSIRGCTPKLAGKLVDGARERSLPVASGRTEAQAAADVAALRGAGAQADAVRVEPD